MRVKNSCFALEGVFTLKCRKQVQAATSNMTVTFSSLLSVKIPKPLVFLNFFTIYNCRCFSACYEKLWGREGRYNLLSYIITSLFSDQKVFSRLFLEIYCSLAFIPSFLTPVVFQLPSILSQPCLVPVSQVQGRLATLHPALRWLDRFGYQNQQGSLMLSEQGVSFQTVFYLPVMVMSQLGKLTWSRGRFSITCSYYIKTVSF